MLGMKIATLMKAYKNRTAAALALGCTRQALWKWEKAGKDLPELYARRAAELRPKPRRT